MAHRQRLGFDVASVADSLSRVNGLDGISGGEGGHVVLQLRRENAPHPPGCFGCRAVDGHDDDGPLSAAVEGPSIAANHRWSWVSLERGNGRSMRAIGGG